MALLVVFGFLFALGQARCPTLDPSFVISTTFKPPTTSPFDYLELFRQVTLSSVVAQEDQNFAWLVLVDDSTPPSVSRALRQFLDPISNSLILRNYTFETSGVRTILPVGIALHARATAYLKATLRERFCRGMPHKGILLGWGAMREWTASSYDRLGALRTRNTPELRESLVDSSNVLTMVVDRGTVLAAVASSTAVKVNQTIYLTQYCPLRACHIASGKVCDDAGFHFTARGLDTISLSELDRNYNLSLPRLSMLKEELAPSPIARRSRIPRHQTCGVTLIVQTTCERLWGLQSTCDRWAGPMVIVLFLENDDQCTLVEGCSSKTLVKVRATPEEVAEPTLYPVNRLRNIGVEAANTTHVFVIDADFWPDSHLYEKLREIAASSEEEERTDDESSRTAVIVPSLEVDPLAAATSSEENRKCKSAQNCARAFERSVPNDFKSLLACLETGNCYMFDDSRNPEGHGTTDFATWLTQHPNKLRPLECITSPRYEPYFMLRKTESSPRYDPAFTGYGKNKISLTLQLRLAGYTFSVLPRSFLTHVPHRQSKAKNIFMKSKYLGQERKLKRHRINMSSLYESLQAQLAAAPNGTLPMSMCSTEVALRIRRSNHACRLAALAKQIQRDSPSLRTSLNWKRHALGYVHTRTFRKCG